MLPTTIKPCKECPRPRYGSSGLCFSHYREREKAKREESKARKELRKKSTKKYQISERKKWHKKCWKLMSEWTRRRGSIWNGDGECYTCRTLYPWKELQAGHFYHRKLDFDERNIRKQCALCNVFYNGKRAEYAIRLIRENGLDWMDKLEADAAQHPGYSLQELMAIHADLTNKISSLT